MGDSIHSTSRPRIIQGLIGRSIPYAPIAPMHLFVTDLPEPLPVAPVIPEPLHMAPEPLSMAPVISVYLPLTSIDENVQEKM